MLKVYCEHGAITADLRKRRRSGQIVLIHFPYDPDARSKHLEPTAQPSQAQWRDANVSWEEAPGSWADARGSEHLGKIKEIVGTSNRRDALHIDSAFKSGCKVFVTHDKDILSKRSELEQLFDIRFFDPEAEKAELVAYLDELARVG